MTMNLDNVYDEMWEEEYEKKARGKTCGSCANVAWCEDTGWGVCIPLSHLNTDDIIFVNESYDNPLSMECGAFIERRTR